MPGLEAPQGVPLLRHLEPTVAAEAGTAQAMPETVAMEQTSTELSAAAEVEAVPYMETAATAPSMVVAEPAVTLTSAAHLELEEAA